MPTQQYRLKDGTRIPGTTTVIGGNLGWNKQPLMFWAWQQGKDGLEFRETTQKAADAGTLAHAMAEADIKGSKFKIPEGTEPETLTKAESAYSAYLTWKSMSRLELVESEVPYVSELYRYGGTIDAVGKVNGKMALVDFKTSNGLYSDHLIQVAAYKYLYEGNHDHPLDGGIHILRFSKEGGHFHHHFYPREAMEAPFRAFVNLREIHGLKKSIEGMT